MRGGTLGALLRSGLYDTITYPPAGWPARGPRHARNNGGAWGGPSDEERAEDQGRQGRSQRAAAAHTRRQDRSLGLLVAHQSGEAPAQPGRRSAARRRAAAA